MSSFSALDTVISFPDEIRVRREVLCSSCRSLKDVQEKFTRPLTLIVKSASDCESCSILLQVVQALQARSYFTYLEILPKSMPAQGPLRGDLIPSVHERQTRRLKLQLFTLPGMIIRPPQS